MSKQSKKKLSEVSMLSLVNWRREIFEIYSDIRRESNVKRHGKNGELREKNYLNIIQKVQLLISKVYLGVMLNQFYILTTFEEVVGQLLHLS